MKNVPYTLIIILILAVGCEKKDEIGEILFCTNSHIANCGFSIEISIDGNIRDTLTAASRYSSIICTCPESSFIGLILDIETGLYTYHAKELVCAATNRINEWSGSINVSDDNCETVILDITE